MATDDRSLPDLLSHALAQFGALIRTEMRLARAEITAKSKQAALGVGLIGAAALAGIGPIVLLLLALALWFVELGLSPPLAHLLAAVVGLLGCAGLALLGLNRLKPENLTPDRTLEEVQRDVATVKEHVK